LNINNYGPISNLPFLAKKCKESSSLLHTILLSVNGVSEPFQSGLTPITHTEMALSRVDDDILGLETSQLSSI